MGNKPGTPSRGVLLAAAGLAGLAAVAFIGAGLWLRHWQSPGSYRITEGGWWAGVISHLFAYLALGKTGFKVALAVMAATFGLVAWIRRSG